MSLVPTKTIVHIRSVDGPGLGMVQILNDFRSFVRDFCKLRFVGGTERGIYFYLSLSPKKI